MIRLGEECLDHPFVTIEEPEALMTDAWWAHAKITLTEAGHDVLAGRLNALSFREYWNDVAGVHLDARNASIWCRDGKNLRRIPLGEIAD